MIWWAILASASPAPDFIGFSEQAARMAVMSHSVASCRRLGFSVDEAGLAAKAEDLIAEAAYAGIDRWVADSLINQAVSAEGERMRELAAHAQRGASERARFLEFWNRRCADLTLAADSAAYFSR